MFELSNEKDESFNIVLTKSRTMLHFHILFQVKILAQISMLKSTNTKTNIKPVGILEGLPKKN